MPVTHQHARSEVKAEAPPEKAASGRRDRTAAPANPLWSVLATHVPPVVQTKLEVGAPDDEYEREADRVADQVMRMPAGGPPGPPPEDEEDLIQTQATPAIGLLQRQPAALEEEQVLPGCGCVRRQADGPSGGSGKSGSVGPGTESPIESLRGRGEPLDPATRADFETRFGRDFSQVQVHTGPDVAQAARDLHARAFTSKQDIYFAPGCYEPQTPTGERLLAHELVHVVQQDGRKTRCGHRILRKEAEANKKEAASYVATIDGRIVVITEREMETRRQSLIRTLHRKIASSLEDAKRGKAIHVDHMENVRGTAGLLSDWWNDIIPPWTGMWSYSISLFNEANARLAKGDIGSAYIYYENGRRDLLDAQHQWRTYLKQTIEGAEATVTTLEYVRDAALAVEVGLLTGGTAYAVGGGGAAVTAGATLLGVGEAVGTAAGLDTGLGADIRGTLREVKEAGLAENAKLALNGLGGIVTGIGEGLEAIGESLLTLFTNPKRFFEDLARMPSVIAELYRNRKVLWTHFQRLPPEEQAFAIGKLTGNIEAVLISIKATQDIGGALKEMASGAGIGGPLLGSQDSIAAAVSQLNVIRAEAIVIAAGQASTAIVSAGLPVAVPHSFAMGMQDVLNQLGEGPHTEAMYETGKAGIGAAEKPRHHVMPKEERVWFEDHGFKGDLDTDQFTVELEQSHHEAIHGGGKWRLGRKTEFEWNKRVMTELRNAESRLAGGKKLTAEQIIRIVEKLMKEYRIPIDYVPYR